jgi:hypothetical protein
MGTSWHDHMKASRKAIAATNEPRRHLQLVCCRLLLAQLLPQLLHLGPAQEYLPWGMNIRIIPDVAYL